MAYYDAIFKDLMNDERSCFVPVIADEDEIQPLATHAGWATGRSVDFFARVHESKYVHLEVQTRVDRTMKWRMANYFSLLHHRVHKWKKESIEIDQYLVYLGSEPSSMTSGHPRFGLPYAFNVIDLYKTQIPMLEMSEFYGDRIISLLTEGKADEAWLDEVGIICTLQDEADKMEGLFYIRELAALRGKTMLIDNQLAELGLYEALKNNPFTAKAAVAHEIAVHIRNIDEFLIASGLSGLSADERDLLEPLPLDEVKQVMQRMTWHGEDRSLINASAAAFHNYLRTDEDDDEHSDGTSPGN
ncbi:hypothetical protein [Rhizobium beringeri]|uniref:hypothetical protein n=1 Tax=Rhizobium beringeri TaxID=3019934 RepID=UPI003B5C19A4